MSCDHFALTMAMTSVSGGSQSEFLRNLRANVLSAYADHAGRRQAESVGWTLQHGYSAKGRLNKAHGVIKLAFDCFAGPLPASLPKSPFLHKDQDRDVVLSA